jgi:hypothetical protein
VSEESAHDYDSEERKTSHMQPILDHISDIVRPALRKYLATEEVLTAAFQSGDTSAPARARQEVMLAARQAVDVLHHLSDFVLKEPPSSLAFPKIEDVRNAVSGECVFLRTSQRVADVELLRDVADAFKHHRPDRSSATVRVSSDVVPLGTGWGQMRWGEGKYGGAEQVVITAKDGNKRALSSVLQNVFDAWMKLLGQPLQPIGQY